MNRKVLVTYASKYGSTREIAEKAGEVLRQEGLEVDVLPVGPIKDLARYQAVVLGSAIYIGKWRKEAVEFLRTYEKGGDDQPIWLFCSGPSGQGNPVELLEGNFLPEELKPVIARIQPRDIAVFHGNIDPGRITFLEKWAIKNLVKKPFGDYRDWSAIASWATGIARTLIVSSPHT